MITISAFKDREEALISKALLEAAGVPVTLKDEFGELQLQVRDTDAQLAQDVLISTEPAGWHRRNSRRRVYSFGRGIGVGKRFLKGGGLCVVGFLLFLLLLMPLGVAFRVTPFVLVFLFIVGGCISVIRGFFKIKPKRPLRRGRSV